MELGRKGLKEAQQREKRLVLRWRWRSEMRWRFGGIEELGGCKKLVVGLHFALCWQV
jgi:hypothetical protein